MSTYSLDIEAFKSFLEFLKYLTPLFSAFVASYLTYQFSRKDKIRDHLFTYKVKAYLTLATGVLQIQKDIITVQNNFTYNNFTIGDLTAVSILRSFTSLQSEHSLLLSDQTRKDLYILELSLINLVSFYDSGEQSIEDNIEKCKASFDACDIFISKLQDDLGMYHVGTGKKK